VGFWENTGLAPVGHLTRKKNPPLRIQSPTVTAALPGKPAFPGRP
jgi:hypothetical protein